MTKSVVMIAHAFPPEGNAGTYRPLRFVRHLAKAGWQTSVIAAKLEHYERYDPGLLVFVPNETEVVRVRRRDLWQTIQARRSRRVQAQVSTGEVARVAKRNAAHQLPLRSFVREMVHTAEAWCYHPDMEMAWIRPAADATVELCRRKRPRVIWATGMPWSAFMVARRAAQRTGVPYVLDFRSSWTLVPNDFEGRRPGWAQRYDRRTLSTLFQEAQAAIFAYDTEAECYWRAYRGALDAAKIHVIPNGYDGPIEKCAFAKGDRCVILYAGTLDYRYDTLLQALHWLKQTDPIHARQLHFLFVGEGVEPLAKAVATLELADIVTTRAPVPYAEITKLQQEAHALLILGRPSTMKGYDMLAGAKLFGYLRAGRPILGVLPADEAKKILFGVGATTVADVTSRSEIVAILQQLLDAWSTGTLSTLVPDPQACAAYSAEQQTAALMRALEGTPACRPFIPGIAKVPPSLEGEVNDSDFSGRTENLISRQLARILGLLGYA